MAERPEDLNLPNAVITRIIKEAVRLSALPLLTAHHWTKQSVIAHVQSPLEFPHNVNKSVAYTEYIEHTEDIDPERLPDGVNVSKEARRAISQAASVFVLYATSCANSFAMKAKRKTLNAGDVMSAMEEMEFERFLPPLRDALEAYKMGQKGKKEASELKRKDKEKKSSTEENKSREEEEDEEHLEDEQDGENEEDVEN